MDNESEGQLNSPAELVHRRQQEFIRILALLQQWLASEQKLYLGVFHEFHMVRYVGWLVSGHHGFVFEPEDHACTVSFFPTRAARSASATSTAAPASSLASQAPAATR